jgi:pimeloyl-ACP methyl ester carboxylesterase
MKPALVFLHGIATSAASWAPQIAHFEDAWTALAWNAPGFGGREMREPWNFPALAGYLVDDLLAVGIESFALVGHSFGGMVAQQVAQDFPGRLTHLVLAGTSPAFGDPTGEFQMAFIADRLRPLDEGKSIAELAKTAMAAMMAENADPAGRALAIASMSAVPQASYRKAVATLSGFDLRGNLGRIAVPTLVLAGAHDANSPLPMKQRMAAKIPGAQLAVMRQAGHMMALEQPAEFNRLLDAFLKGETS